MKYFLIIIFLWFPAISYTQDSTEVETTQAKQKYMFKRKDKGGYFGLTLGASSIDSTITGTIGFRFMSVTNRWMSYGLVMGGILSGAVDEGTSKYTYPGAHIGFQVNPIIFPRWIIHLSIPTTGGVGWMGKYELVNETTKFFGDSYFVYGEVGLELEFNMARKFRISFGLYYTYRYSLPELSEINPEINHYSLHLNLKWGNFGFISRY